MAEKNVCGEEGSWTLSCLFPCPDVSELSQSLMCAGKTQHDPGRENHDSMWSCGWINNMTVLQKGFMQSQNNLAWKGLLDPLCPKQCKLQSYIKLLRGLFNHFWMSPRVETAQHFWASVPICDHPYCEGFFYLVHKWVFSCCNSCLNAPISMRIV